MGQNSSGVVTATASMAWPGWVGVMNWFMTVSNIGVVGRRAGGPAHDQGAVESVVPVHTAGDSRRNRRPAQLWPSPQGRRRRSTQSARVAVRRRFPIPSATANVPMRPMYVALPIVVPPPGSWRNDGRLRPVSSSAKGTFLGCVAKELSSAPLQISPISVRDYVVAISGFCSPHVVRHCLRRLRSRTMGGARPRHSNVVRSAASVARMPAALSC